MHSTTILFCIFMFNSSFFITVANCKIEQASAKINNNEISSSSLPELHREFGRFSQITPKLTYHKDQKLDKKSTTSNSPYTNKKGGPDLTITYKLNDEDVIIDLNLNSNLLPNGHYVSYQLPNGSVAIQNFTKETVDLCHFHGHIRNKSNRTFVALSTCESKIRGIVNDEDETYYIENDKKERQHFIYRHTESNRFINNLPREQYLSRRKRDSTPSQQLRKPYNSNRRSSYVELVLVIDNSLYQKMDRNITKIHRYSKDLVNIVNGLYTPLNIFVSLLGVVVWSERDEITVSPMANETLANFLSYRETRLRFDHPNDNAHLLTNVTFNDNVVGKALYGVMCSSKSGGVEKVHSELIGVQAATVAHEMGHNFGMDHDNETECECIDKDAKCIMSPTSSYLPPRHWSSCSINYLAHTLSKGMNYCLKNAPTSIFDPPTCGNGFLEMGEECDCGISENCQKNLCCNPLTCKFTENATCATGECCDLTTCSLKPASVPCRPISGECDLPEFCLGDSEFCPKDVYKRDTEVCKNGQAFCYQGGCSTHDDQCKVLWGQGGHNFETCYPLNQYGNNTGNCGFNHRTMEFTKCLEKDQMCGILHCYSLSGHLEFGDYIAKITSIQLKTASNVYTYCYAAFLNISVAEIDPGMSPNGAKCGDGLMCYNQRCENVTELNEKSVGTKCPEDCRGHGICNSLGHCHCDIGFTGDACEDPGFGGSIDSGPSSDPNVVNAFGRIMLILFCGALPASLLFTLFIIYLKKGGLDTSGIHHTIDTVKNLPHRIRGL